MLVGGKLTVTVDAMIFERKKREGGGILSPLMLSLL